jgi:hypothetical protein
VGERVVDERRPERANSRYAPNRIRSTPAPEMIATVMPANIAW